MNNVRYFISAKSGEYFVDKQLRTVEKIMGMATDQLLSEKILAEVTEPNVLDILQANSKENLFPAMIRYKQLNKCSTKKANETVYGMVRHINYNKAKVFENEGKAENDAG